jgi:hypothetical protein
LEKADEHVDERRNTDDSPDATPLFNPVGSSANDSP